MQGQRLKTLVMICVLASSCLSHGLSWAAGATGGIGLTEEILVIFFLYPFVAVGLSYLLFRTTGKEWVFFLGPFFYMGMTMILSYDSDDPASPPGAVSLLGLWLYWIHILGVAIIFPVFKRTNRAWLFFFAPIVSFVVQFLSLMFLGSWF